jgi:hypothetical protein
MPGSSDSLFKLVGEKGIYPLSGGMRLAKVPYACAVGGIYYWQICPTPLKAARDDCKNLSGAGFYPCISGMPRQGKQYVYMFPSGIINYTGQYSRSSVHVEREDLRIYQRGSVN